MLRVVLRAFAVSMLAGSLLQARAQSQSAPASNGSAPQRALLDHYCVTCHNEKLKTAGLMLDKMDVQKVPESGEVWEKVIGKLRAKQMPPAGMPRPDPASYDSFRKYLETALDQAAASHPQPGRPAAAHRLNRVEYTNAVHDLLAVDIDGESLLPSDDASYGFDNIGDVLSVSPMLMEAYMSAARKISRIAIGDSAAHPVVETYDLSRFVVQDSRASEDLPFGSRGGTVIRRDFPVDGEYEVTIRLQIDADSVGSDVQAIAGLSEPHQLDVRLDGERIKLFAIGGGDGRGKNGSPESTPQASAARKPLNQADEAELDAGLQVRFPVRAGRHVIGVTFVDDSATPEGVYQPRITDYAYAGAFGHASIDPGVASITIGGPYDAKGLGETPSRRKIFVCHSTGSKDEEPCAKTILSALARRAYRRPVRNEDVQVLLKLYRAGREHGSFEEGIETALQGILVDPEFLFRVERDPLNVQPGSPYRISDLDLASRLSFFLWSSIPDDELLSLAERGQLKDSEVLEQQVRRMLNDPRSQALVTNFAGQWLYLRNVLKQSPNPDAFPDFGMDLLPAFKQETELFFQSMLREDHSVLDLLSANYTFLNEKLARHYGIPNVYGNQFRRVTLTDPNRMGLLGQGSILVVTSYATRTAPTIRGKFLMENVLGTPPPPPPPNVPSLGDGKKDGKRLTMRQQMEEHRANPTCASCHKVMDPLGFALENFDGVGQWRTTDAGNPIDVSGTLPDGTKFEGPTELRRILLSNPEQFAHTVTTKLLTYALGRGVEYYDEPAIRKIMREAAPGDYRWSSLILGIVKSEPFQMKESAGAAGAVTEQVQLQTGRERSQP